MRAEALAQLLLLGAAAGEHEVQAGIVLARRRNASASSSEPFSRVIRPAVEDVRASARLEPGGSARAVRGSKRAVSTPRSQRIIFSALIADLGQRRVGGGAGGEDEVAGVVEGADGEPIASATCRCPERRSA